MYLARYYLLMNLSMRVFGKRLAGALVSLPCLLAVSLTAAPADLDQTFLDNVGVGITPVNYPIEPADGTGAVNAVALQSDGKIIAGGNVSTYQGTGAALALRRLNADGTLDSTFNAGGSGLADSQGQPEINDIIVLADDSILICGVFTSYDGNAVSGIAKLTPDGDFDSSWTGSGLTGSTFRYGFDMVLQPDGKVIVVGGFQFANGVFQENIARFEADGSLDTSFDPDVFDSAALFGVDLDSLGNVYIAGARDNGFGVGTSSLLRRLFPDGTTDEAFDPGINETDGDLDAILVLANGSILVSGNFFDFQETIQASAVAAFLPSGELDTAFNSNLLAGGYDGWAGGFLEQLPNGQIFAGGIFTLFNGQSSASIIRLEADGTVDTAFTPAPYAARNGDYGTHFYDIAVQPDGKYVVGGWFERITDPELEINNIARFEGDLSDDPGTIQFLASSGAALEADTSVPIEVGRWNGTGGSVTVDYSITAGTAVVGTDLEVGSGTLTFADGVGGIEALFVDLLDDLVADGTTTVTITLSNPGNGATLGSRSTFILDILDDEALPVITQQPTSVEIFEGQDFTLSVRFESNTRASVQWFRSEDELPAATSINYSVSSASAADHAGTYTVEITNDAGTVTSQVVTVTIATPAGSFDSSFFVKSNPYTGVQFINGTAFVYELPNGQVLAADRGQLIRLNSDGSVDGSFSTAIFNSSALDFEFASNGDLLIGGVFNLVNDQAIQALVGIDPDGALDSRFASNFFGNVAVYRIEVGADGSVFAGLSGFNGLAKYSADGVRVEAFDTDLAKSQGGLFYWIHELPDGDLLVSYQFGGSFDGPIVQRVARLNSDGTPDAGFTEIEGGEVSQFLPLPDGRFMIAGTFTDIRGVAAPGIAIVDENFNVDTSFNPGSGIGGEVADIILLDGLVILLGPDTYNGAMVNGLARITLSGGRDPNFAPLGAPDGTLLSLAAGVDGAFYVGGNFTQVNSRTQFHIARYLGGPGVIGVGEPALTAFEDGETAVITVRRLGSGEGAASVSFATQDGTAVAGTDFTAASGTLSWPDGDTSDRTITIDLTDNTALDGNLAFSVVLADAVGDSVVDSTATITILDDESLPQFTAGPDDVTALEGDEVTLSVTVSSPTSVTYQWRKDGEDLDGETGSTLTIAAAALDNRGVYTVVATNDLGFRESTDATLTVNVDADDPVAGFTPPTFNSSINDLALLEDGSIIVGGIFSFVDGSASYARAAKLHPDGTLDTSVALNLDDEVRSVAPAGDGGFYIGGDFTQVDGQAFGFFAKIDAQGNLDTAFHENLGSGPNGQVNAVTVLTDGSVVFGGEFTSVSGDTNIVRLARVAADGTLDTSFFQPFNDDLTALTALADGGVIVGGDFTGLSGNSFLVRLNSDGSINTGFTGTAMRDAPNRIIVQGDKFIILGGQTFGGRQSFCRLNANGTFDNTFTTVSSTSFYDGVIQRDGTIIAGGSINSGGIVRIAKFSPDGVRDPSFMDEGSFSSSVFAIEQEPNGNLLVAGQFGQYRGVTVPRIVRLNGLLTDLAIDVQPENTIADPGETVVLETSVFSSVAVSLQWTKDGDPLSDDGRISGAQTDTLTIATISEADNGFYALEAVNAFASETSADAQLTVRGAPVVLSVPADFAAEVGEAFELAVDVVAAEPVTYTWRRGTTVVTNGNGITGADSPTLTFAAATPEQAGTYRLTIENALDTASAGPIEVTVTVPQDSLVPTFGEVSASARAYAVAPLADGSALVGGEFSSVFGANGTNSTDERLVRILPNGEVDETLELGFNTTVQNITPLSDGGFLIASGSNGFLEATITKLNANLEIDTSFTLADLRYPNRGFIRFVEDAQGRILFFGTSFADDTPLVGRLNANGSLDESFAQVIGTSLSSIRDVVVLDSGAIIIAGTLPPGYGTNMARLDADGTLDTSFAYDSTVVVDRIQPLGDGTFLVAGGAQFAAVQAAVVDATGSEVANTLLNLGTFGPVVDLDALENGGYLVTKNNQFRTIPPVIKFDDELNLLTANDFDIGSALEVAQIEEGPDGLLWVVGNFTNIAGSTPDHVAVFYGDSGARQPTLEGFAAWVADLPEGQRGILAQIGSGGVPNLIRYATGMSADAVERERLPLLDRVSDTSLGLGDNGKSYIVLDVRISRAAAQHLSWSAHASATLPIPADAPEAPQVGSPTPDGDDDIYRFRAPTAVEDAPETLFIEIRFAEQE